MRQANQMWVVGPFIVGWRFPKGSAWPWHHFGAAWCTHMCQRRGASQANQGDGGVLSWRRDNVGGGVWPAQLSLGST